jgi:hypothetical protein
MVKNKSIVLEGVELQVSRYGRVYKKEHFFRGRKFKKWPLPVYSNKNGCWYIRLKNKNFLVHRLVATIYVPNPLGLRYVGFVDGNRSNPHYKNLRWVKRSVSSKRGRKLNERQVLLIKDMINSGMYQKKIADVFNIDESLVSRIKRGSRWN